MLAKNDRIRRRPGPTLTRVLSLGLLLGAAALLPAMAAGPQPTPGADATGVLKLPAPITAATVYSDRARVARAARLTLAKSATATTLTQVMLPPLCGRLDPSSIRVDVQGSGPGADVDVARIEISDGGTSTPSLPMSEGELRRLLHEVEGLDDSLSRLSEERGALQAQLNLLSRLSPVTPPQPQNGGKGAALNPAGWGGGMAFVRDGQERLQRQIDENGEKARALSQRRKHLAEQVRLAGGDDLAAPRRCQRVTATLRGHGTADLWLSYVTLGARWTPAYDIQLTPGRSQVELAFSGQVSQDSGEDWTDVVLTLSTAVPSSATQLPRLVTWKLGSRERFIPTPMPAGDSVAPPPRAVPPRTTMSPSQMLQWRLLSLLGLGQGRAPAGGPVGTTALDGEGGDRDHDGVADVQDATKEEAEAEVLVQSRVTDSKDKKKRAPAYRPPPPPPPAPPPPVESVAVTRRVRAEARMAEPVMAAVPGSSATAFSDDVVTGSLLRPTAAVLGVGLAPPPGYTGPGLDSGSAAARAGGYDLAYPSLYRETIGSGKGSRRVALFSRSFPVSVQRKIFPALASEAYLVAVMKNPTGQPLPGGRARLFVGADPSGEAELSLVAAGEPFTLPLGLDRAIKPVRNVRVTTEEKGLFSKDEISEYTVTTELVNPYREPLNVLVVDQLPLGGDKNVEIQLVSTTPTATPDVHTGALSWQLQIPPGGKVETRFVYTLRRPKGARLYQ